MITKLVIKKEVIELWQGDEKVDSYARTENMTLKLDSLEKIKIKHNYKV